MGISEAKAIGKRWSFCADGYNAIIQNEFSGELSKKWSDLLIGNAPCPAGKVLDVGTGPGFFALLMGSRGWDVHGIDCAEKMIETAVSNAQKAGIDAEFSVMDSHSLDFPDNTFDYIVGRNVTWILYEPEKAFKEWLRVLKPGGRLLYLDGNWHYTLNEDWNAARKADEAEYREKYGTPPNSYRGDEKTEEEFKKLLYFNNILRPDWDIEQLPVFGYENIKVTPRLNEEVYSEEKQLLYRSIPLFMVTADKASIPSKL